MTGVESICIFPKQPNKDRYTFHRGSGFLCFVIPINRIMLLCFCFGTRNFLVLHRKKRGAPRFLKKRFATPPFFSGVRKVKKQKAPMLDALKKPS